MGRKGYIFTNKTHAKKGIMAAILGVIVLATLFSLIYLSFSWEGVIPERYAAGVFVATLMALVGFVLSIVGLLEDGRFGRYPMIGALLNGLGLVIVGLLVYLGL